MRNFFAMVSEERSVNVGRVDSRQRLTTFWIASCFSSALIPGEVVCGGGLRSSLRLVFLLSLEGGFTTMGAREEGRVASSVDMFLKVEGLEVGWGRLLQASNIFPFGAGNTHGSQEVIQDFSRMGADRSCICKI